MLVFWKQKLVFLAMPKTGTTAFETVLAPKSDIAVLDPPQLKHASLYRYDRFFRTMFEKTCNADDFETLAVMREPISWLSSWYRYRRRPFMEGKANATHDMSFDEFVQAYMRGKKPGFANVGSQANFLTPRPDAPPVTHLFRYENQGALIAFLEERLEMKIDLPRENVSPNIEVSLSAQTEAKLRRKCAEEFELYNSIS